MRARGKPPGYSEVSNNINDFKVDYLLKEGETVQSLAAKADMAVEKLQEQIVIRNAQKAAQKAAEKRGKNVSDRFVDVQWGGQAVVA